MPEGDEGWRQSRADSGWRVELRPGMRSSFQLMHNNLPRTEAAMLTTEMKELWETQREKGTGVWNIHDFGDLPSTVPGV